MSETLSLARVDDASVRITDDIVDKTLAAYAFPLRLSISPGATLAALGPEAAAFGLAPDAADAEVRDEDDEGFDDFDAGAVGDDDMVVQSENGELILDSSIEAFVDLAADAKYAPADYGDAERAVYDFFMGVEEVRDIVVGSTSQGRSVRVADLWDGSREDPAVRGDDVAPFGGLFSRIKRAVKSAWSRVRRAFSRLVKKIFKWELIRVDATIRSKPRFKLGNPISARGVDLSASATGKACVKVFKWRCVKIVTPAMRFDIGRIDVNFDVQGRKVFGRLSVSDFDWVITIRIFGFRIKIKIGLTKIVNKELAKMKPYEIVDLSSFERELPFTAKRMTVAGVAIGGDGRDLLISVETAVG